MRIGIYGGTFDPVHLGHLILAETCRAACGLDEVWLVPAQVSPHKLEVQASPPARRLDMLEFAVAGLPEFRVSRIEIDRPGPSFTFETLEQLHCERPGDEFFLLIGADSVIDFPKWRSPQRIAELATLVVVNRGRSTPTIELLKGIGIDESRVREVEMPGIDLSASSIRERVRNGQSIRFLVPRPVEHYIREQGLYRG
jgi:nicotinate-nucleotide adenylyltransferase